MRHASNGAHERLVDDHVIEASPRAFGLVFAGLFTIVALTPLWSGGPVRWWSLGLALVLAGVALARPVLLSPLSHLWQRVGLLLHRIVSPLVMGALFYLVVTPFAVAVRLAGSLHLEVGPDPGATSYWRQREARTPGDMRNQF